MLFNDVRYLTQSLITFLMAVSVIEGLEVIDEIPEWEPNTAGVLKVKLEPGNYQLLCNIEGHYKNGMHAGFEVLAAEKK